MASLGYCVQEYCTLTPESVKLPHRTPRNRSPLTTPAQRRRQPIAPAPGARVVARDAEWVVRRVDMTSGGNYQLACTGVSEIVRDRQAVFLSELERIEVLEPENTRLVPDRSPAFADSLLYMESRLRQVVANDEHIHVGHGAAMDLVPYQLEPARQALAQPRQRILVADAVGLGKTLEAGILVSELIARGRGRRILVLAVKSMLAQFQKEFWNRFTIGLTRLDSAGIQRVRRNIPGNHNPFHYYDKTIISIDTLKQDAEYRTYLENAYWDIIVIDEAHNVADRGTGSLRSRLAKLLSRRSDTLIMLSATPHDGRARSFASLMNMLDATAIADPDDYEAEDFRDKGLVIRRFKKDIQHEVEGAFQDRRTYSLEFSASEPEEAAYKALLAVEPSAGEREGLAPRKKRVVGERPRSSARDLFAVTLEKALFSSPAACVATVDQRLRRRGSERANDAKVAAEVRTLQALREKLDAIGPADFAKYQGLLTALRSGADADETLRWRPTDPEDRLAIFTERIETLNWLADNLRRDLQLRENQVEILHGGMSDLEQQRVVEDFGNAAKPVRLLLCSDVASEGINLHYHCHRLIHFDMPWSLMVFAQRNGRVDRYGQERTPQIVYLTTRSNHDVIRGDVRVLEVLKAKDEQAYRNIGDPSAFMGVHDIEEEQKVTTRTIAAGTQAAAFDATLTPAENEGGSLLALFTGGNAPVSHLIEPAPPPSLYADDLAYCEAALHRLRDKNADLRFEIDAAAKTLTLDAPEDLRHRFAQQPSEAAPEHWRFVLTTARSRMADAIAESRRDERAWPREHYLWRLHPVVEWLNDRTAAAFGRHEAPVLAGIPGLASTETAFVFAGLVPNRRGHPLLHEWIAVCHEPSGFAAPQPFEALRRRIGLGDRLLPNRQESVDVAALERLLPEAVQAANACFAKRRNEFEDAINDKLNGAVAALDGLKNRRLRQLDLRLDRSALAEPLKEARRKSAESEIDGIFGDYLQWIEDVMTTEDRPWVSVVCLLVG